MRDRCVDWPAEFARLPQRHATRSLRWDDYRHRPRAALDAAPLLPGARLKPENHGSRKPDADFLPQTAQAHLDPGKAESRAPARELRHRSTTPAPNLLQSSTTLHVHSSG